MGYFKQKFRQIKKFPNWIYWLPARLLQLFFHTLYRFELDDRSGGLYHCSGGAIGIAWQNRLLYFPAAFPAATRKRCSAVVSASRDGQYVADFIKIYGIESVRGSSSKRGAQALIDAVHAVKRENRVIIFTPDGPRGPRYTMKPGLVQLASMTGVPVCPISLNVSSCWSLRSWDGFQIPKPGAKIKLIMGETITVPPDLNAEQIEFYRQKIENALRAITLDPPSAKREKE